MYKLTTYKPSPFLGVDEIFETYNEEYGKLYRDAERDLLGSEIIMVKLFIQDSLNGKWNLLQEIKL